MKVLDWICWNVLGHVRPRLTPVADALRADLEAQSRYAKAEYDSYVRTLEQSAGRRSGES